MIHLLLLEIYKIQQQNSKKAKMAGKHVEPNSNNLHFKTMFYPVTTKPEVSKDKWINSKILTEK